MYKGTSIFEFHMALYAARTAAFLEDHNMRLDKYLKVSRLIKRRTVANEVADAGRILINGKIAKASQAVKAGDIIEVTFGNRPIKVKVLSDVEPRTKDVAREMYEIIAEGEQA
jgi:ribosomal 50S subunit-recycling heat shock protein